jgi:hypothetical protein
MNKHKIIFRLDWLSKHLYLAPREALYDALKEAVQWLEQTETVEEVREALERLTERFGFEPGDLTYEMEVRDSPRVDGVKKGYEILWAARGPRLSDCIDEIQPEPSNEPPDPSEIEPGEEVILKTGPRAKIYPKTGQDEARFLLVIEQENGGWMASSLFPEQDSVDWKQWRKEKQL